MLGIYSINVCNYGVYVCTSNDILESLNKNYIFLKNKIHHNYVLQRVYNIFPEYVTTREIVEVDNIEKLNFLAGIYRLKFPFTIDSYMRYQRLDKWYIIHKYQNYPELLIYVDEHNLAHIVDAKTDLVIGIELGDNFQSGRYIHNKYSTLRKIQ